MNNIMSTNIYTPRGTVAVVGSCLPETHPEGYKKLEARADEVYCLCLEETHINMAVTKLSAVLSTGQVEKLIFASVDRSPHCTQLHYIEHELRRVMELHMEIEHYVVPENEPVPVSDKAIELSKTLSQLTSLA